MQFTVTISDDLLPTLVEHLRSTRPEFADVADADLLPAVSQAGWRDMYEKAAQRSAVEAAQRANADALAGAIAQAAVDSAGITTDLP